MRVFHRSAAWLIVAAFLGQTSPSMAQAPRLVRSTQSGPWSAAATWEGGKIPTTGVQVLVKKGHTVTYDVQSKDVIRSLHISGVLTFTPDRDIASGIRASAMATSSKTAPRSTTSSTATSPARPCAASLFRNRCYPSTRTTAPVFGGRTASTRSSATSPSNAPNTVSGLMPSRARARSSARRSSASP